MATRARVKNNNLRIWRAHKPVPAASGNEQSAQVCRDASGDGLADGDRFIERGMCSVLDGAGDCSIDQRHLIDRTGHSRERVCGCSSGQPLIGRLFYFFIFFLLLCLLGLYTKHYLSSYYSAFVLFELFTVERV